MHEGKNQHTSCTAHHGEPLLCPCLRTTCNFFWLFILSAASVIFLISVLINFSPNSRYVLEVYCSDNGVPVLNGTQTVFIHMQDVDNNPPLFSAAAINVSTPECSPLAMSAFQVSLTILCQSNKRLLFRLLPSPPAKFC